MALREKNITFKNGKIRCAHKFDSIRSFVRSFIRGGNSRLVEHMWAKHAYTVRHRTPDSVTKRWQMWWKRSNNSNSGVANEFMVMILYFQLEIRFQKGFWTHIKPFGWQDRCRRSPDWAIPILSNVSFLAMIITIIFEHMDKQSRVSG